MPQKRSKDQLISQILTSCQGDGAGKTRIVYQVGLNFRTINPYLSLLTKKGHLEAAQGDRPIYRTTPKGEQALEHLREVEAIYS
jgi:predicted transcriptional regulator